MLYDFDVVPTDTQNPLTDTTVTRQWAISGLRAKKSHNVRFRHAETADAAATAPPAIRLYLEELGFDFTPHESAMPAGQYDANDDTIRLQLIDKMNELSSNKALRKALTRAAGHATFDVAAFITCAVVAKPMRVVTPRRPNQLLRKSPK